MNNSKRHQAKSLALMMTATLALAGCAGQSARHEVAPANGVSAVSPEVRHDFDAAMQLMQSQEYGKGIELLNAVATKSQNNAIPYINLAIAQKNLGDLKSAEDSLKKALALEPDNPVANNELGIVYRMTGRFDDSRQVYENILKKYPNYALANKNLGILCDLYLRDYACALKGYQAYSLAMPGDKNAKIWISDVQKRAGQ